MTKKTRRSVLQGGAALTGTLALGFPAIVNKSGGVMGRIAPTCVDHHRRA